MKHIGFLSSATGPPSPQSQVRSASDALLQSIELAVAAEEVGANGAYFRVHHFARQLGFRLRPLGLPPSSCGLPWTSRRRSRRDGAS
jgi:alkanesulfonate monooxygenase SsuD/methylene tetrahydromethanopterin reductase-like flavin-dependent oxidoreductase (luciferase family)